MKKSGIVMETDPQAKIETLKLQNLCREYLPLQYGPEPYIVRFDLKFPETMPDFNTFGADGSFTIQMGPASDVPYSVFYVS